MEVFGGRGKGGSTVSCHLVSGRLGYLRAESLFRLRRRRLCRAFWRRCGDILSSLLRSGISHWLIGAFGRSMKLLGRTWEGVVRTARTEWIGHRGRTCWS
jgi:hypothetical protein